MGKYCPYCLENGNPVDSFYTESYPYENEGEFVNRCMTCNQWSAHVPGEPNQVELSEELRGQNEWQP